MWLSRRPAWQRQPKVLIVDADEQATSSLAHGLGSEGLHVFWTLDSEVGLRLSSEHLFDVIVLHDQAVPDVLPVAEQMTREGQRCVVLSASGEAWPPGGGTGDTPLEGAVRRPLEVSRIVALATAVVDGAEGDAVLRLLDHPPPWKPRRSAPDG